MNGFTPTGRFGIGFLSVFMLGDEITVSTKRDGEVRYRLSIHGLGRRAELRIENNDGYSGTEICITLKPEVGATLAADLADLCRNYFPLLPVPIEIKSAYESPILKEGWLLSTSADDLRNWVRKTTTALADRGFSDRFDQESLWVTEIPEYTEVGVRLLADRAGRSILCLRGFALQSVMTPGFLGVINSETVTPDASRRRGIDMDLEPILQRARLAVGPSVSLGLDALGAQGFSANRTDVLRWCYEVYGIAPILNSSFRFIQVVRPDGSSQFVSTKEFSEIVVHASSIFVGFNAGPNMLLKDWHKRLGESVKSELGVCFADDLHLKYLSADEVKTGSLDELLPAKALPLLFRLFMLVLKDCWNMEPGALMREDGWVHKAAAITGFFRRVEVQ